MTDSLLMLRAMERAGWDAAAASMALCDELGMTRASRAKSTRDTIQMVIDGRHPAGWTYRSLHVLTRLVQALSARSRVSGDDCAMLRENLGG
jgi:hypothetical protein